MPKRWITKTVVYTINGTAHCVGKINAEEADGWAVRSICAHETCTQRDDHVVVVFEKEVNVE